MLHQPSGGANGMAADIAIMAEEIIKTRARLNEIYAEHTGQVSYESGRFRSFLFRGRKRDACLQLFDCGLSREADRSTLSRKHFLGSQPGKRQSASCWCVVRFRDLVGMWLVPSAVSLAKATRNLGEEMLSLMHAQVSRHFVHRV